MTLGVTNQLSHPIRYKLSLPRLTGGPAQYLGYFIHVPGKMKRAVDWYLSEATDINRY